MVAEVKITKMQNAIGNLLEKVFSIRAHLDALNLYSDVLHFAPEYALIC